jgi:hypothetical protein
MGGQANGFNDGWVQMSPVGNLIIYYQQVR